MYTTEEFREQVYLWYDTNGITVGDPNEGNWERAHIVPQCVGGTETVLLLKGHHLMHDLYQSREYNRQCFHGRTKAWLYGEGFLCENWFELVSLYEHYSSRHSAQNAADRWATMTPEERSAHGRRRVQARWANTTPEERSARGRMMVEARWANATDEDRAAQAAVLGAVSRERWANTTPEQRRSALSAPHAAAKARWATLTPEERSAEMSRRRRLGQERKRALRGLDGELHGALWSADTL